VTSVRLAAVVPFTTEEDLSNFAGEGQVDLTMPGFRKTVAGDQLDDITAFIRRWKKQ